MKRLSVDIKEAEWLGLRRLAEERRDQGGRANVASVVRGLITREVSTAQEEEKKPVGGAR
jgi:hypothetical protein